MHNIGVKYASLFEVGTPYSKALSVRVSLHETEYCRQLNFCENLTFLDFRNITKILSPNEYHSMPLAVTKFGAHEIIPIRPWNIGKFVKY